MASIETDTTAEARREARRAYKRKWTKEHPENVKRHMETFWDKQAAQMQEQREAAQA